MLWYQRRPARNEGPVPEAGPALRLIAWRGADVLAHPVQDRRGMGGGEALLELARLRGPQLELGPLPRLEPLRELVEAEPALADETSRIGEARLA